MLNITEVRVHVLDGTQSNLKAYASITVDDCFVVHGLKILQGDHGLFVGMPRRRREAGAPQDVAHPLNTDTRRQIENAVLDNYAEVLARAQQERDLSRSAPRAY